MITLLLAGLVVLALGDLSLAKSDHKRWKHLEERQRALFGQDLPQEVVLSLLLCLPIIGIYMCCFLFISTVDTMIELRIPDLVLAVLYLGSFAILFLGPSAVVRRAGAEYAKRSAAAYVRRSAAAKNLESGRFSSVLSRREAEMLSRLVLAAGFMMTGMSLISMARLPMLAGIPLGLMGLGKRLQHRKRYHDRCKSVSRVLARQDPGNRTDGSK